MEQNFSDGLELLIKKHISVAEPEELISEPDSNLRKIFKDFVEKAQEKMLSIYCYSPELDKELVELQTEMKHVIAALGRIRPGYLQYLAYRDVLSVCVFCPYVIPRQEIYEVFQKGLKGQVY